LAGFSSAPQRWEIGVRIACELLFALKPPQREKLINDKDMIADMIDDLIQVLG
jgi:hypothetical protein